MCNAPDAAVPYVAWIRAHAGLDAVLTDPVTELSERKKNRGLPAIDGCLGAHFVVAGAAADSIPEHRTGAVAGVFGEVDRTRDGVGVVVEVAMGTTNATTTIETGTGTAGTATTPDHAPGLDRDLVLARGPTPGRGPAPGLAPRLRRPRGSPGRERFPLGSSCKKLLQL